jgi:pyruvate carboxylase
LGTDPHSEKAHHQNPIFHAAARSEPGGISKLCRRRGEAFTQRACDNGIDIFRVFDALNDFRNFQTAVKIIKKNKKHFQGTICYSLTEQRMGGDIYNIDYYVNKAKQLEKKWVPIAYASKIWLTNRSL